MWLQLCRWVGCHEKQLLPSKLQREHNAFFRMKIYVHLDEDSSPLPPHTLKIDDASPLTVSNIIEQFCAAYAAKVKLSTQVRR